MSHLIDFPTNDATKRFTLAGIELAGHADYFRCTLHVISRGFCCKREFYFDIFAARRVILALEKMKSGQLARGVLKQEYEEDFVSFSNDRLGHVTIDGVVFERGSGHRMMFELNTDQTGLPPFVDGLREAIGQ